jgi:hypothetical protein
VGVGLGYIFVEERGCLQGMECVIIAEEQAVVALLVHCG